MMNEKQEELHKYLTYLGEGGTPHLLWRGVCNQCDITSYIEEWVDINTYPNGSGEEAYPLKSLNKRYTAKQYYKKYTNLWTGKRGIERRKFCLWIAAELERKYG